MPILQYSFAQAGNKQHYILHERHYFLGKKSLLLGKGSSRTEPTFRIERTVDVCIMIGFS